MEEIVLEIKLELRKQKISQKELSRKINRSQQSISGGLKKKNLSPEMATLMFQALGIKKKIDVELVDGKVNMKLC